MQTHDLPDTYLQQVEQFYVPLAKQLQSKKDNLTRTFFIGINGCQGSGKSTLTAFLSAYFEELGLSVANLSLDDFYLTRNQRTALATKIHPMFSTRGVPGTHDTTCMKETFTRLKESEGICNVPRFDKASDNPFPESEWSKISLPVDIVLMEGWCWGVSPQLPDELSAPVNQLEATEDPLCIWRQYVNKTLESEYLPLYSFMDFWVMLSPPGFENVHTWRLEQEQKLANRKESAGKQHLMSAQQIEEFIQYYQRLTEQGFNTLPSAVDVHFELDPQRQIIKARGLQ